MRADDCVPSARSGGANVADGIVVTGVGAYTGFGDTGTTIAAIERGLSGIAEHRVPGVCGLSSIPGAPAPVPTDAALFGAGKLAKYMSPATRFAVVAAGQALADAGLLHDEAAKQQMGLFAATGRIAFDLEHVANAIESSRGMNGQFDGQRFGRDGLRACHPLLPFKMLLNMPLGLVSIVFGIRGPNAILYPDAEQGGACFEMALRRIRGGEIQSALVGGVQQGFSLFPLAMQTASGRTGTSVESVAPFRRTHEGLAPADIGAFVVLESAEAARARGIEPYASVITATICHGLGEPVDDAQARVRAWTVSLRGDPPGTVLCTGAHDWDEDRTELAILEKAWPGGRGDVVNLDGRLGDMGPAAPSFGVVLAASILKRGRSLGMAGPVDMGEAAGPVDMSEAAGFRPAIASPTPEPGVPAGGSLHDVSRVLVSARTAEGSSSAILLGKATV